MKQLDDDNSSSSSSSQTILDLVGYFLTLSMILSVSLLCFLIGCYMMWHRIWWWKALHSKQSQHQRHRPVIAFFHPHCAGGGGGERVLWKMIQVLSTYSSPSTSTATPPITTTTTTTTVGCDIVVYTIDPPRVNYRRDMLRHVAERFQIHIPTETTTNSTMIHFVHLHRYQSFLQPSPRLSLVVEAIRTMQLAQAAFQEHATLYNTWSNQQQQQQQSKAASEEHRVPPLPDWWIDTTGCAFTFWVAKFGYGCRILPYVHYPTISTDMLRVVYQPRPVYGVAPHAMGQSSAIVPTMNTTTRPMVYTGLKLIYYTLFACAYGLTGSLADYVMVNSTWTYQHIRTWWKLPAWRKRIRVVYPPCLIPANPTMTTTTTTTTAVNINNSSTYSDTPQREAIIVSIGQFRPEKDHMLQILAMERLLKYYPNLRERKVKMVLIGSCRPNAADQERLQMLQTYAKELPIEFVVNQPQGVVQEWFRRGSVGIHTVRGTKHGVGYPYE